MDEMLSHSSLFAAICLSIRPKAALTAVNASVSSLISTLGEGRVN